MSRGHGSDPSLDPGDEDPFPEETGPPRTAEHSWTPATEQRDDRRLQAAALQELIDTPGTGSIPPLDRRVELIGQHDASRREGELVTVAEAEPDGGSVAGRVLEEVAQEAAS